MNNMYGKDKFHDRQKAVLQKSAQKIENDSGWAQNNFMREYAEEILPASGAELSFGELCAIGEHVEQEAAFSAKEAMRRLQNCSLNMRMWSRRMSAVEPLT